MRAINAHVEAEGAAQLRPPAPPGPPSRGQTNPPAPWWIEDKPQPLHRGASGLRSHHERWAQFREVSVRMEAATSVVPVCHLIKVQNLGLQARSDLFR